MILGMNAVALLYGMTNHITGEKLNIFIRVAYIMEKSNASEKRQDNGMEKSYFPIF